MTNRIDKAITDAEWEIHFAKQDIRHAQEEIETATWFLEHGTFRVIVLPLAWLLVAVAVLAWVIVDTIHVGGTKPNDPHAFPAFFGLITAVVAAAVICERLSEKKDASADIARAEAEVAAANRSHAEATDRVEALKQKRVTLRTDFDWASEKLISLATLSGFTDEETTRMRAVLDATREAAVS